MAVSSFVNYFAPGLGAEYCDECVCVCMSVCPLAYLKSSHYSTKLNEHLWTQVLKHISVHIYLVTSVYQVLQST